MSRYDFSKLTPLPRSFWRAPIAHRGLYGPGAPENSLAAAEAAAAAGYAIELDVQPTWDGEAVVFHDPTLPRMCGCDETRSLWELVLDVVLAKRLLAGEATQERIPTLGALLQVVAGRVPLFIELKGDAPSDMQDRLLARVTELLAGYEGPATLMSSDRYLVGAARVAMPERPVGLVASQSPLGLDQLGANFVTHAAAALPSRETLALREAGIPVLAWTITSPSAWAQIEDHADQMTFSGFRPATSSSANAA